MLHLGEERLEAVSGADNTYLFVHLAVAALASHGVDGFAVYLPFAEVFSREEAGAGVRHRAVALEAAGVRGRYLAGGQSRSVCHFFIVCCLFYHILVFVSKGMPWLPFRRVFACFSHSQELDCPLQVFRRVDADGGLVRQADLDAEAIFQPAQLLQAFGDLEGGAGEGGDGS